MTSLLSSLFLTNSSMDSDREHYLCSTTSVIRMAPRAEPRGPQYAAPGPRAWQGAAGQPLRTSLPSPPIERYRKICPRLYCSYVYLCLHSVPAQGQGCSDTTRRRRCDRRDRGWEESCVWSWWEWPRARMPMAGRG